MSLARHCPPLPHGNNGVGNGVDPRSPARQAARSNDGRSRGRATQANQGGAISRQLDRASPGPPSPLLRAWSLPTAGGAAGLTVWATGTILFCEPEPTFPSRAPIPRRQAIWRRPARARVRTMSSARYLSAVWSRAGRRPFAETTNSNAGWRAGTAGRRERALARASRVPPERPVAGSMLDRTRRRRQFFQESTSFPTPGENLCSDRSQRSAIILRRGASIWSEQDGPHLACLDGEPLLGLPGTPNRAFGREVKAKSRTGLYVFAGRGRLSLGALALLFFRRGPHASSVGGGPRRRPKNSFAVVPWPASGWAYGGDDNRFRFDGGGRVRRVPLRRLRLKSSAWDLLATTRAASSQFAPSAGARW